MRTCNFYTLFVLGYDRCGCISVVLLVVVVVVIVVVVVRWDEVTGEWMRLHNEELSDLYSSPNFAGDKIEKNEMGRACGAYG